MKKVIIIQTAFIGDVILTLPLVQSIKNNYPDSLIDFLCIPYTANVLMNNPNINEILVYDKHNKNKSTIKSIIEISNVLKRREYNIAFIPHRSLRSAMIAFLSGIEERIAFSKLFFNWIYTKTIDYTNGIHEVDRNISLLDGFIKNTDEKIPQILFGEQNSVIVQDLFFQYDIKKDNRKIIAIAPGSIWYTKRWLIEYYEELCRLFADENYFFVLIGGRADIPIANEIIKDNFKNGISLCGVLSIQESAEVLKKCDLLVSNDSASVHIASSVGLAVIDIYGPTLPEFGFYPLSQNSKIIEQKKLNCRPCGIHGGRKCPVGSFDCMKETKPNDVMSMIKTFFASEN